MTAKGNAQHMMAFAAANTITHQRKADLKGEISS